MIIGIQSSHLESVIESLVSFFLVIDILDNDVKRNMEQLNSLNRRMHVRVLDLKRRH